MLDPHDRERIEERVRAYNAQVADIRANPLLSERGKREQIKDLYDQHKTAVDTMRAHADKTQQTTAGDLERRLFGMTSTDPGAVISYRDAADRVSSIKTPAELADLMTRAHHAGDEQLVRAGFAKAWQESKNPLGSEEWDGLVRTHVELNPAIEDDLTQLAEITSSRGKTAQFVERLATSISKPKELDDRREASDEVPAARESNNLVR